MKYIFGLIFCLFISIPSFGQNTDLLNDIVDISDDFKNFKNTYFLADSLVSFDMESGTGEIRWQRNMYTTGHAFNNTLASLKVVDGNEFPGIEYAAHPALPFDIDFISPKTIRIRIQTGPQFTSSDSSLMIEKPLLEDNSWDADQTEGDYVYKNQYGSVTITTNPWHIEIRDAHGKLLTKTRHKSDSKTFTPVLPFSFVHRASDYSRSVAAVFSLQPGEKIYGGGDTFSKLDKRGQRVYLWLNDPNGVQNEGMYKPVPVCVYVQ